MNCIMQRYSNRGRIPFDDFVSCCVRLRALTGEWINGRYDNMSESPLRYFRDKIIFFSFPSSDGSRLDCDFVRGCCVSACMFISQTCVETFLDCRWNNCMFDQHRIKKKNYTSPKTSSLSVFQTSSAEGIRPKQETPHFSMMM